MNTEINHNHSNTQPHKHAAKKTNPIAKWLAKIPPNSELKHADETAPKAKLSKKKRAVKYTKYGLLFLGILLLVLALFSSYTFLRQRQLCSYQQLVDAGRVQSKQGDVSLCPNLIDTSSWGQMIANAFNFNLLGSLEVRAQTVNDDAVDVSNCVDQLNPLCWVKGSKPTLKQDGGFTNLLLAGLDTRPNQSRGPRNTDSIMLVSIDNTSGKVLLISFPRDLLVYYKRPNGYLVNGRINAIYANDGVQGLNYAIEQITGKKIHYYAYIHFTTFLTLIDKIGGVDITLSKPFADAYPCLEVPAGVTCPKPRFINDGMFGLFKFPAGLNHFDSFQALVYSRAREYSSDYARAARQQEVFKAVLNKALKQNLSLTDRIKTYSELYNLMQNEVVTNITVNDIAAVVSIIDRISGDVARVVADPNLGGLGRIINTVKDPYGTSNLPTFRDHSYHQFQQYISQTWTFLPYYIERPKVLFVYASDSLKNATAAKKLFDEGNPFWATKTGSTDQVFSGIKIYDFSGGSKSGTLRDLQASLPGSLIYSAKLDKIKQSDFGEDILVMIGR